MNANVERENSQDIKQNFDRDGFVVIRQFLTEPEVVRIWHEIERYKNEVVPYLPSTEHLYEIKGDTRTLKYLKNLSRHDAFFKELFEDTRFVGLASRLLGESVVGDNIAIFNKPPRVGEATPLHQDGFYFMLEPMEAVTYWLALEHVNLDNGCVRYLPGSHREGLRPHVKTSTLGFSQAVQDYGTPEQIGREVAIAAGPGDLLIHHCLTIHRADPNLSDHTRHALGMIYYSSRARTNTEQLNAYQETLNRELTTAGKV